MLNSRELEMLRYLHKAWYLGIDTVERAGGEDDGGENSSQPYFTST